MAKLAPCKQKIFKKKFFGFDIETADDNKDFVCASIVGDNYLFKTRSAKEFIEEVKNNSCFRNSVLFATNLGFDFFGTFFSSEEQKNFFTLFRGSDLLLAKSYFYKDKFYPFAEAPTKSKKTLKSITFLDSLNFAKLSVSKMGKIIGIPKIETPDFIGKHPKNVEEWNILEEYNERDSKVTYEFMKFLIPGLEELGATFKNTLAATALSLFRNKYLKNTYYQPDEQVLLEQFESYYGGRTEAFKRGQIKGYNYYDFNSLYPSVMESEVYPDPNSLRITRKNTNIYINMYEGCSDVEMWCPENVKYPVLPVRLESGKVIFPTGHVKGWYTHIEIREAIANGYVLTKVNKTQYFTRTCRPFRGFVQDLYSLRNQYKAENNSMEYLVKITMNSLYGKFGQKFLDKDNWQHESTVSLKDLAGAKDIERKGSFVRLTKDSNPASFCIPIWASYVAAYGRIKLHRAIKQCNPVYVDTDSLITDMELPQSKELGDLKLEMTIKEGYIVRPKFYAMLQDEVDDNGEHIQYVKIKGLGKRLSYFEFVGLLNSPLQENGKTQRINYDKFTKFKEALRRDFIPNEIINVHKEFSLEDEKRVWSKQFNMHELQEGIPIRM